MSLAPRRIYVASSWRNPWQPGAVQLLRALGNEVYDFRNPRPGVTGFAWSSIDPDWLGWKPARFRDLLRHPIAQAGFANDFDAMEWADTFVLLLPCGRSAHLEAGWAIGAGKPTCVVLHEEKFEPELMYLLAPEIVTNMEDAAVWIECLRNPDSAGEEPECSMDDECGYCTGELCRTHGYQPCDCDAADRHASTSRETTSHG